MVLFSLTAIALVAFAANSVLCRMALGDDLVDPVTFTAIRLSGGAIALSLIFWMTRKKESSQLLEGAWRSAIALYGYALAFSLAYVSLSSGTGALILFGAVQITMLLAAFRSGEQMGAIQWTGFCVAIAGIIYLVSPGIAAPDLKGALLMMISGMAWGMYSIAGKSVKSPIAMTTGNFIRAAIMMVPTSIIALVLAMSSVSTYGVALALTSGVVTSGMGYVIWYKVVPMLTTTQAAVVQLLVPLLAALGGVIFIGEQFTVRLALASLLILGGVVLSIFAKKNSTKL